MKLVKGVKISRKRLFRDIFVLLILKLLQMEKKILERYLNNV